MRGITYIDAVAIIRDNAMSPLCSRRRPEHSSGTRSRDTDDRHRSAVTAGQVNVTQFGIVCDDIDAGARRCRTDDPACMEVYNVKRAFVAGSKQEFPFLIQRDSA